MVQRLILLILIQKLTISIEELEKKLIKQEDNKLTKDCYTCHFESNFDQIYSDLSKQYNFKIIEDASHAYYLAPEKPIGGVNILILLYLVFIQSK